MDAARRQRYQKCLLASEKSLAPTYVTPAVHEFERVALLATGSPALCHACLEKIRQINPDATVDCIGSYPVGGGNVHYVPYAPKEHFSEHDFPFDHLATQTTSVLILYNNVYGLGYHNVHSVAEKLCVLKYYAFNVSKRFMSLNFKKRDAACRRLQTMIEQHEHDFYAHTPNTL